VSALTHAEAAARAALIEVDSCDVFLDLAAHPVRSRTEVRFRCREPGAATFADLATAAARSAVLNGRDLPPAEAGRLALPALAAENVLVVDAEVAFSRDGLSAAVLAAAGRGLDGYSSRAPASAGTSTEYRLSTSSGTTSSARSWVDASTTGAAAPSRCARSQFAAVTHHRSPGTSPGKLNCGIGVDRSLPMPR
jgi:hypothetical protein